MKINKKRIVVKDQVYERRHEAVLMDEVLLGLNISRTGEEQKFIDVTLGAGKHTEAILQAGENVSVLGIDWDDRTFKEISPILTEKYGKRVKLVWGNFAHLYKILKKENISGVNGILADFGTSQDQIFSQPGFSFNIESPLDMRMSLAHSKITAYDVVNHYSVEDISSILFTFGEESFAKKIAKKIVESRISRKIMTTTELAKIILDVKHYLPGKIHPATKTFQALRIYVNKELENISSFLKAVPMYLKPGGRLVCISFHSLEDKLVKNFLQEQVSFGRCRVITRKVLTATDDELTRNISARSAKLRIAEF